MTPEEELAKIKADMAALEQAVNPIEDAKRTLKQQEQEAYAAYTAVIAANNRKREEMDNNFAELRRRKIEAENRAKALEREILRRREEAEAEKRRQEALDKRDAQLKEWDKLTMGAPWREFAKDHQISAGHFITHKRKVILADPMGLGKTLSSIITADMVEAVTRDSSVEFPKFGESGYTLAGRWVNPWSPTDDQLNQDEYEALPYEQRNNYVWRNVRVPCVINGIERPVGRRILYFCPSSLLRNVMKEFKMWTKSRNVTYVGGMTKGERRFAIDFVLKKSEDFVVICNYEAWRKDWSLIQDFITLNPDTVIIDEAHNIKDRKSIGYRGIKELLDVGQPEYVIPMTGTPILNRPQELFTLLTLVNPNRFREESDFLYSFCEQDEDGKWRFQPGGLDRVAAQIKDNFMRRTKSQAGIVLPEKTVINHDLVLDKERYPLQAEARDQMRKFATIVIDENEGKAISATAIIAMYTRLRQIETWPAGIEVKDVKTGEVKFRLDVRESQKVDYVISNGPDASGDYTGLIPEVIDEERIVLFSQFRAPLLEIQRRITEAGYSACILDGSTSAEDRERINNDFDRRYTPDRSGARYDVVLCNYKVGGVGLNLTAATQLIALDEEWNPGKREQAFDRIHRIGQTEPVTIHIIRNQKTVDDWLAGIMEQKEAMVNGFEQSVTSISDDFKSFITGESGLM